MRQPTTNINEKQALLDNDPCAESWQIADIREALKVTDQEAFATPQEIAATFAKFGVRYDLSD